MEAAATVELALDAACDLGEGPVWDARTGRLYFVDINRNAIHAYTPPAAGGESAAAGDAAAERHFTITLDEPVGCVALTSDPSLLLAATRRAVRVVRVGGGPRGAERALAEAPAAHGAGEALRFNDGKVSPQGAFILGRMHSDWRKGERGRLYSLDPGAAALRELLVESGGGGGGGGAHLPSEFSCFLELPLEAENALEINQPTNQPTNQQETDHSQITDHCPKYNHRRHGLVRRRPHFLLRRLGL
jgi:hypothetical protein